MSVHYNLLHHLKTRIGALGLADRNGVLIPGVRIKVVKTDVKRNQRVVLEDTNEESFPGILICHQEDTERWDEQGSTNLMNLIWYPVHIAIVDLDRGDNAVGGKPEEADNHELQLNWRQTIHEHIISQRQYVMSPASICRIRQIRGKVMDFRDWLTRSLWHSSIAYEFGFYLPRATVIPEEALQIGGAGLLVGEDVGLKTGDLLED